MSQKDIQVKKNWQVKSDISEREEHLFYRAMRTHAGAKYTPMACSSKVNSVNSVSFNVLATCEYVTDPVVKQYVNIQYEVKDGIVQKPEVSVIGPEKVDFKLQY